VDQIRSVSCACKWPLAAERGVTGALCDELARLLPIVTHQLLVIDIKPVQDSLCLIVGYFCLGKGLSLGIELA
jgi:hypothetical protein